VSGLGDAFSLEGRSALVTGGASGIGAAICRALVDRGADVILTTRPGSLGEPRVVDVVRGLEASGRRVAAVELDVRRVATIDAVVHAASEELDGLDLLVNNAGTNIPMSALDVDEDTWDRIVDTNLKGLFFTCQSFVRHVRPARNGKERPCAVVNIASQMGLVGWTDRAPYCASKAGVVNLTKALAVEWAPLGIRVNAVAPTFVHTPLADAMLQDDAFRADVLARIPMGRIGDPEDAANAVVYLSGRGADLVTGETLAVDGGWTAW
jgi:2-deoxy-D-gluconate 3-dehydrogenase